MVPDAIRRLDHIRKRSYELANSLPMKAMIKAAQWGLLFLVDVPESNCLLEEEKAKKDFALFKFPPAKLKIDFVTHFYLSQAGEKVSTKFGWELCADKTRRQSFVSNFLITVANTFAG